MVFSMSLNTLDGLPVMVDQNEWPPKQFGETSLTVVMGTFVKLPVACGEELFFI
jgi:hypothetical protein